MLCGAMIDRVALDALVLKARFPELQLREGERGRPRGQPRGGPQVIVLAGVPLTTQLPPGVREGETLHLRVQEVTAERVTLRLDPAAAQAALAAGARRRRRRPPGSRSPTRRTRPPGGDEASGASRSPSIRRSSDGSTSASTWHAAVYRPRWMRPPSAASSSPRPPRRACRTRWRAAPPGRRRPRHRPPRAVRRLCLARSRRASRRHRPALRGHGRAEGRGHGQRHGGGAHPRARARRACPCARIRACGRAGRHGRGARVPEDLWMAVAEVLVWAYELEGRAITPNR